MLEWAAIWLSEHAPGALSSGIVHGDFRIGNFLVDEGHITAILDWELVRLGDPVEDLGWICMRRGAVARPTCAICSSVGSS